jgi:hypothetical protein
MTITFHNSAGTHGQQTWKPLLLRWLRQHTPGPWQAVQGMSPRQPGGTECGTHTLFNMIAYTTDKPHPDISTIQWSHSMRTHILNRIVHAGYTPHTQDTAASSEVEIIPNPTHKHWQYTQTRKHNTWVRSDTPPRDTRSISTFSTHTHTTQTHSLHTGNTGSEPTASPTLR